MNTEEHDELWHLLGKSKQIEPTPFLARNILRELRRQQLPSAPSLSERIRAIAFRWKFSMAAGTTAMILIGAGAALNSPRLFKKSHRFSATRTESIAQLPNAKNPDYEIIAHLDDLIASQESSLWSDGSQD